MKQRSRQWFEARKGKITASRFREVMFGGASVRNRYLRELLGIDPVLPLDIPATNWGLYHEPIALARYEFETGNDVDLLGFCLHDSHELIGGSPDGEIGLHRGIEIKCPYNPEVHEKTLKSGMPKDHLPQVQGLMWIRGWLSCDFVSFDPRAKRGRKLYVENVPADPYFISRIEKSVLEFRDKLIAREFYTEAETKIDVLADEIPKIF